ncbi:MAG: hypothetical protein II649_04245 [Kiritimatiellae bacterium]|nr:hypothetical protein [Kiritimatiellia bacterium]
MNKNAVITELFKIREDLHEKALSAKTPEERMHYAILKHACESDILNMETVGVKPTLSEETT